MPIKRSNNVFNNSWRRRIYKFGKRFVKGVSKYGPGIANAAYTGLRVAQRVAALVNTEFKWFDTDISLSASTPFDSSTAQIITLTPIPQGTGPNEMIGQSVRLKSIYARLSFVSDQNASANPWTTVRVLTVIDFNMDGSTPGVTDILQYNAYDSPMSMNMPGRYKIISDNVYTASNTGNYKKNIKIFKNLNHHYKTDQNGVPRFGTIYAVFLTDSPNPYGPFVDGYYRIRFIDN